MQKLNYAYTNYVLLILIMKEKSKKTQKSKKKTYEKIIIGTIVGISILNFLLVLGFFIFLFMWVKSQ